MLIRILLAFLILGFSSAHADIRRTVENAVSTDTLVDINVPSNQTVYTKSVSLVNHGYEGIGVMYKAASSGTIGVTIQAQRTYALPTTEAVADTNWVVWNPTFSTTDGSWHMATLDTVNMPYLRFMITGTGANANSTTLKIKVEKQ